MKSNKSTVVLNTIVGIVCFGTLSGLVTACGGGDSSGTSGTSSGGCPAANTSCTTATGSFTIPNPSNTATIPVYVADASTTGQYGYANEPLVSVTVCTPNHTSASQCQTISNILLDTGSYGLRVFGSAITNTNVQLTQQTITVNGQSMLLGECATFGSGADWGAVQTADVLLGNQTATNIPIQVINYNFAQMPDACAQLCPDTDPCTAGYNGILGVGLFAQDCGAECANYDSDAYNPGNYFGCNASGCNDYYVDNCGSDGVCVYQAPMSEQVVNPVASFASGHNNGVALSIPSAGVSSNGGSAIQGTLTLGIGTLSSVNFFEADTQGMLDGQGADFTTAFQGTTYGGPNNTPDENGNVQAAFIDSGSNGLFFPSPISTCPENTDFYCGGGQTDSATMSGYYPTGSSSPLNVSFTIGDADTLFNSGNSCFNNLGGPSTLGFDWGFPFFVGRTVYVGLNNTQATINSATKTGPYWAF